MRLKSVVSYTIGGGGGESKSLCLGYINFLKSHCENFTKVNTIAMFKTLITNKNMLAW